MIYLWTLILSHAALSHGKYLLIETDDHNITSKDYFEDGGSLCAVGNPFNLKYRKEVECGRGQSNCFQQTVEAHNAASCRVKVKTKNNN